MLVNTAELTGKPLDWAVAKVLGQQYSCKPVVQDGIVWMPVKQIVFGTTNTDIDGHNHIPFDHANAGTTMGLIDQHKISLSPNPWFAKALDVGSESRFITAFGSTLAEAVARCIVSLKIGDVVEIPDELMETT